MPRNVRNFWIDLNVDGRNTTVATGPIAKDGGFTLTVRIRNNGMIERAMELRGHAFPDGRLELVAENRGKATFLKNEHDSSGFVIFANR